MAGPEFFQTIMGHKFYQADVPRLVNSLERIAEALEKIAEAQQPKPEPKKEKPAPTVF